MKKRKEKRKKGGQGVINKKRGRKKGEKEIVITKLLQFYHECFTIQKEKKSLFIFNLKEKRKIKIINIPWETQIKILVFFPPDLDYVQFLPSLTFEHFTSLSLPEVFNVVTRFAPYGFAYYMLQTEASVSRWSDTIRWRMRRRFSDGPKCY